MQPDRPAHRIAEGFVSHRRGEPLGHAFRYRVWMLLADVDRLDALAATSRWLSIDRPNLLTVRSRACLPGYPGATLRARAGAAIRAAGHPVPTGPMLLLHQPASLGVGFNPVRFVFCLDARQRIEYVLAEINNTPWNERHTYVLRAQTPGRRVQWDFPKSFHVSPFNSMAQRYRWSVALADDRIEVRMALTEGDRVVFRAGLRLRTVPVSARGLRRGALRFAAQPLVQLTRIYRQAAALWWRGATFYDHPGYGVQP